jgi:hypothetical protein
MTLGLTNTSQSLLKLFASSGRDLHRNSDTDRTDLSRAWIRIHEVEPHLVMIIGLQPVSPFGIHRQVLVDILSQSLVWLA